MRKTALHRWLYILLLLGTVAFAPAHPLVQTGIQVDDVAAFYIFNKQITFQAKITPAERVRAAYLFLQPAAEPMRIEPLTISPEGALLHTYDLINSPLNPFTTIQYWFRFELDDGAEHITETYAFDYVDNRFDWQTLSDNLFKVYWYGHTVEFGQAILNAAQAGLKSAQAILPAQLDFPLRVYVYSSTQDYQTAVQTAGQTWAAGHANPELDLILISIAPGAEERLELERQVPHEIAHILQYHLTGENYYRVPVWFLEGAASLAELYPNPDYESVLQKAAKTGALLPLEQLCGIFPREASGAFLAYAQSTSFTRFLLTQFGSSGLTALLSDYQDGLGCLEAPQHALGKTFAELETRWRQEELGVNIGALVVRNLSPYLALLGIVLVIPLLATLRRRAK